MTTKPLLNYPSHSAFAELLNSCASMTKQLENLGQQLTVTLLQQGFIDNFFYRYISLNLNQQPVVIAASHSHRQDQFFVKLLQNAHATPIGKFLFAEGSVVQRQPDLRLNLINFKHISQPIIKEKLLNHGYQAQQKFWQRRSVFTQHTEKLYLTEIILPELKSFY